VVSCGVRGSGWEWRSRSRLRDQERIKSWEEMDVADGIFSCDVALVNLPLILRLGLLGWAMRGEMVRGIRMNGGAGL
jgi:hypothetical protein